MDMEIKVTIDAPGIVMAIMALAEVLERNYQSKAVVELSDAVKTKVQPQESTEPAIATLPVEKNEPEMDVIQLRKTITDAIKAGTFTNAEVRNSLSEFGKTKLTDLHPEQYKAFLDLLFEK